MFSCSKKGLVGVGVLIIFLSTILAAAVTAGVLMRTSNKLQQKTSEIEETVRERIVTGLEVVGATSNGDTHMGATDNIQLYARLSAGSSAISLEDTAFLFTSDALEKTASLQNFFIDDSTTQIYEMGFNDSKSINDLDGDGEVENLTIAENCDGLKDCLRLEFSNESINSINLSLETDITNASRFDTGISMNLRDYKFESNGTTYGYLYMQGTITEDGMISGVDFYVSKISLLCDLDSMTEENRYCAYPQVGNADSSVDAGELLVIKYKLKKENALKEGENIEVRLVPKEGEIMTLKIKMPNVIRQRMSLM